MCKEMCMHIAQCPEEGRAAAFVQSTQGVEMWLDANCTHLDLTQHQLQYLRGRGTTTCLECLVDLNLTHILREFAVSQYIIGLDSFVMGMHVLIAGDHPPMLRGRFLGLSLNYCK
jgi:hypothetical protein